MTSPNTTEEEKRMKTKYRKHNWYDEKNNKIVYGIQARPPGNEKWMHVSEGLPLLYVNESDRDTKLDKLRKKARLEK